MIWKVRPYRSGLVGERAATIKQRLADEEQSQKCQQDCHTGDSH